MLRIVLIISAICITINSYSQSFIGKSKEQIKEISYEVYDEVEVISETSSSIKLKCNSEINEFFLVDRQCVKFLSTKSYECECLDTDIKTYNKALKPVGTMRWVNNDNSRLYEILLDKKSYTVSITNYDSNLAILNAK
jgi:hypothetical protein